MDSLTQIVLGAAVGEAVLGKKVGNKAMLWGAVCGTIPDLDVFFTGLFSPIDNLYVHRGFSHSIFFALLLAPLLGYLIHKIHRKRWPDLTVKNWMKLVFWSTVTHPLLDMLTNWGTQLFWPFDYRIAINSVFVLDPLYTLPFLFFLLRAAFIRKDKEKRAKINRIGLIVSTSYLMLSLVFKWIAHERFEDHFQHRSLSTEQMMTKPMPLTTFYWTGTTYHEGQFYVGYYSIFGGMEEKITRIDQNDSILNKSWVEHENDIERLKYLTKGFYIIREDTSGVFMEDIRFGLLSGFHPDAPNHSLFQYQLINKEGKWEIKRSQNNSQLEFEGFGRYLERIFGINNK